jgi:methyl-accepting chemotaxis protein
VGGQRPIERKHYFIDPRLQGRYMLTFLVPMLVMLAFMLFTIVVASQSLVGAASGMLRDGIDQRVTAALQDQEAPSVERYEALLQGIGQYVRGFAASAPYRRALLVSLAWAFGIGLLIVITEIVLLTIYFSHRVAGPIYRLEKVCNDLVEGNYRGKAVLRKGDELQNLASLLNRVIETTRERLAKLRDEPDGEKRRGIAATLEL